MAKEAERQEKVKENEIVREKIEKTGKGVIGEMHVENHHVERCNRG